MYVTLTTGQYKRAQVMLQKVRFYLIVIVLEKTLEVE